MKEKVKIFLCDMVHNYLGAGTYMFPLNIGYIAAYTHKFFSNEVEIKLFKYPDTLLQELKENIPNVIGFSNYTWNADLNNRLAQVAKSFSDKIVVVFGGPNINYTEQGTKNFFITHPATDFYVPFQGETPFVNLLKRAFESEMDISKIKENPIHGIYFFDNEKDTVVMGKRIERIKAPDEIPSPYLTGFMNEFFDYNLIPIIETNRGCPYQCTYCCQGLSSYNQIDFFTLERVQSEIDYVASHVKNTNILNLADSNFGIVKRDFEIADYIARLSEKTGYPRKVNTNWAKNQDELYEIAMKLKNINLAISLQSLDKTVLEKIKRKNIRISVFKNIVERVNDSGNMSGTEIILGLPGETKESHIESIKKLFDWDVSYIICYNCLILDGSEMQLSKEKGEFVCDTKFRLIDSSFGKYNGILSFEYEEGIRSTETMTEDDILFFRPVHWLIQFLWNYRFYYDLLKYVQHSGINPLDYIIKLIEDAERGSGKVKEIFDEFKAEARTEWFDSVDDFHHYYRQPENFRLLEDGLYGKMNGKYIFKVLLEAKKDFEEHLYHTAISYTSLNEKKEVIRGITDVLSGSIIDFSKSWDAIVKQKIVTSEYNILKWRKLRYKNALEELCHPDGIRFHFHIPHEQGDALKKLLNQYKHRNMNVTLRKMSEYMSITDFFYKEKSPQNIQQEEGQE